MGRAYGPTTSFLPGLAQPLVLVPICLVCGGSLRSGQKITSFHFFIEETTNLPILKKKK